MKKAYDIPAHVTVRAYYHHDPRIVEFVNRLEGLDFKLASITGDNVYVDFERYPDGWGNHDRRERVTFHLSSIKGQEPVMYAIVVHTDTNGREYYTASMGDAVTLTHDHLSILLGKLVGERQTARQKLCGKIG